MSSIRLLTAVLVTLTFVLSTVQGSSAVSEQDCLDLTPYAVNPESLPVLTSGGDIPNDVAVYFEIPSKFVEGEKVLYCVNDLVAPQTVGGVSCEDSRQCWLAVGNRPAVRERGVSAVHYNCLCSGSTVNPFDHSTDVTVDGCGLPRDDAWGVTCRDASSNLDISPLSNRSSAYISICPEPANMCGVCQPGGGTHPSFLVGIQWVSNMKEQCMRNPFPDYADHCTVGLAPSTIAGISLGSALLVVACIGIVYYRRIQSQRRAETMMAKASGDVNNEDVERQRAKHHLPPVEEISITTDGSITLD